MTAPQSPRERLNRRRRRSQIIVIAAGVVVLGIIVMLFPPVRSRIANKLDDLRTRITYALNPPDEAIFVPEEQAQLETMVAATYAALTAAAPTETQVNTLPVEVDTPTPTITLTPTITPTPLPERVDLEGVVYVDQHNRWNYCGPANLAMALKFWGWGGSRDDIAVAIKPGENNPDMNFIDKGKSDKNVMPYEMERYVNEQTDYRLLSRFGGDIEMVKNLIANGFPVLIEKGYYEADYTGKIAWLGHYLFTTGYDEALGGFIVQDAYLEPGKNMFVEWEAYEDGWRGFNYLFMVIYPSDREAELLAVLGPWADVDWANRHALDIANEEIGTQTGNDEFFAWFNKGTSHVQLLEYVDAAFAYDYAFLKYAELGDDDSQRPYRIMWYQTGPYFAYFYAARYQDVINLANNTLYETVAEPTLEESIYWRGRARLALGETANAIEDFKLTIYLNKSFAPGWDMLEQLGVEP